MQSTMDVQGVYRGRCKKCDNCDGYLPPATGLLCVVCHHAPGLHQNMSQHRPAATATGSGRVQPNSQPATPGKASAPSPAASNNSAPYPSVQAQRPSLPKCKRSGCSNQVHIDPSYGPFDYCSPQCRDAHLLPSDRDKLQKEIDQFMKSSPSSLESQVAIPDSLQRVLIRKSKGEDLGIIVNKSRSFPSAAAFPAFLITGVMTSSPAFHHFKSGKLTLLSLIVSVGCTPAKDIVESFEEHTRRMDNVDISIEKTKMSISPCDLSDANSDCTHIIALHFENKESKRIGIDLKDSSKGVEVEKVHKGDVPDNSGVRAGDVIWTNERRKNAVEVLASLMESQQAGRVQVLFIRRPPA